MAVSGNLGGIDVGSVGAEGQSTGVGIVGETGAIVDGIVGSSKNGANGPKGSPAGVKP